MRTMLFRRTYYSGISKLSDQAQLEAYRAIMKYAFDDVKVEASPECAPVLATILDSLGQDIERYKAEHGEGGV